jgi:hypothetical protein
VRLLLLLVLALALALVLLVLLVVVLLLCAGAGANLEEQLLNTELERAESTGIPGYKIHSSNRSTAKHSTKLQ